MSGIEVWDAGEKFLDRYTAYVGRDVYVLSARQGPQDVCQYIGELQDIPPDENWVLVPWEEVPEAVRRRLITLAES